MQISKNDLAALKAISKKVQKTPEIRPGENVSSIFNKYFNGKPEEVKKAMEKQDMRAMLYRELNAAYFATDKQKKEVQKQAQPPKKEIPRIQVSWQDENMSERLGKLELLNGFIYIAVVGTRFILKCAARMNASARLAQKIAKGLNHAEKFISIAGNIAFTIEKEMANRNG